jgi:CDP-glucose 4,6-dehydratase
MTKLWGNGAHWERGTGVEPHEGQSLRLDCSKAARRLGWRPSLCLNDGLAMTAAWYRARLDLQEMNNFTIGQIKQYEERTQSLIKTMADGCEVPV